MINLIIAYAFIFVTLVAYGITLYRRTRAIDAALRSNTRQGD